MPRRALLVGLGAVLLLVVAGYVGDRASHRGEVLRGVRVGEVELSGLDAVEARAALTTEAGRLASLPVDVAVEGHRFRLDPREVGASPDVDHALAQALRAGRDSHPGRQAWRWARHLTGAATSIEWSVTIDPARLETVLSRWDTEAGAPGREPSLRIVGTQVEAIYATPGLRIDRVAARSLISFAVAAAPRLPVALGLTRAESRVSPASVDAAAVQVSALLRPVVAVAGSVTATLSAAEVGALVLAYADDDRMVLTSNVPAAAALLSQRLGSAVRPARDAGWITAGESVRVDPAVDGLALDVTASAPALVEVAAVAGRRWEVATMSQPAGRTTAEAEALGIRRQVGTFTTAFEPGQPRVGNIRHIASVMNGVVVDPGASFSVNNFVGPRTKEKGYVEAPVIYDEEYQRDVGGGVSQFATTMYNALFFGGYQIDSATAHAFYISRYPAGREATLSYPQPDLDFTNDSEAAILVRVDVGESSVTVSLYGDNGGRQVEAIAGEPRDKKPYETVRRPDPTVPPGEEVVKQAGADGFTIDVTRVVRWPDGREDRETRTTVYAPPDEIILVPA